MIFHFLLLFPVEIPKIKTNVIFVTVANALQFRLCEFIQLTVTLLGQLKNEHNTQKVCVLYCGVLGEVRLLVTLKKWVCSFW